MSGPIRPRAIVVGILNATPDSFFDGGQHPDLIAHGHKLIEEGADWLDIGGESTRPGAPAIDAEEECRRILPIIRGLAGTVPLSVDTAKPKVAARALKAGASIINDVSGLAHPEMAAVTADAWATIVMHMRGTPKTMSNQTSYDDVVSEVADWLQNRATRARSPNIWLDPGIGFAKTAQQSLLLIAQLQGLVERGLPVLVGASRKSFIGHTLHLPPATDRLGGSIAAAIAAWQNGANAIRVHDVAATRQALDLLHAIESAPYRVDVKLN
jgi:dihydropteroate synthase